MRNGMQIQTGRRTILAALLCSGAHSFALPAVAGVNAWTQLGPEGGALCALAVAPSDPAIVYAVGATYFRSADGGHTWESTGTPVDRTTCSLTVDAADPLRLYAIHYSLGLLRSFDGGATWAATETPFPPFYSPSRVAVDRHDASFLLVAAPGGIYRSRDRGDSWQLALHADHPYQSVVIDPAFAGRGFALSQAGGVQVSDDYGETWRDANDGLPTGQYGSPELAFDPGDPRQIFLLQYSSLYRSRDGGLSWSFVLSADDPFAVEQIVTLGSALFARPGGSAAPTQPLVLRRSLDAGETWQELPDPFPHHPQTFFSDLVGVGDELLATSRYGFVRSGDRGATWRESNTGLLGASVANFSLDRQNPERLFGVEPLSGFHPPGFVRSLDRGATWQHLPVSIAEPGLSALADLVVDPNDPSHYLGLSVGTHVSGFGGVTSSRDGGETWSSPSPGPFDCTTRHELIVDPLRSNRLFLSKNLRFGPCAAPCHNRRSEDSGQNWECIDPPGGSGQYILLEPSPYTEGVVVATEVLGMRRSVNSGNDWDPIAGLPGAAIVGTSADLAWASADTVYVTTRESGLYVSRDGGSTWSPTAEPPDPVERLWLTSLAVDPLHPERIYALAKESVDHSLREVVRSIDGGRTWLSLSEGLLGWTLSDLILDPVTPNRLYVSADGGGILAYDIQEPEACVPSATALCITDGRFKIESIWRDFAGRSGVGNAHQLASDTGSFWFFDPDNLELFVKEIDGVSFNNAFWTFYGALSNVEFTLLATDTVTGAQHGYFNPSGRFASQGDILSFPQEERLVSPMSFATASVAPLRSRSAAQRSANACEANATTLCFADGRFAASVTWRDFAGRAGVGTPLILTPDTGSFWFFDAGIHELAVKVIDGRGTNDAYWVFYGSLSNVEFELTVVDTETGDTWTRDNPLGTFASDGDIEAFPQ